MPVIKVKSYIYLLPSIYVHYIPISIAALFLKVSWKPIEHGIYGRKVEGLMKMFKLKLSYKTYRLCEPVLDVLIACNYHNGWGYLFIILGSCFKNTAQFTITAVIRFSGCHVPRESIDNYYSINITKVIS